MYEGNNPTALASREWLINALLSLMIHKPYSKITVMDICKTADLSRQTFYNFFETKDDMIRFCLRRCSAGLIEALKDRPQLSLSDIVLESARVFRENQSLIALIIFHELEYFLESEMTASFLILTEKLTSRAGTRQQPYAAAFLAGAISHTLLYQAKTSDPLSPEELTELLYQLLPKDYYQIQ